MTRTSTETSPQRTPSRVGANLPWPQSTPIQPPLDARRDPGFVAARMSLARRPPALSLSMPIPLVEGSKERTEVPYTADPKEIDFGVVASLSPNSVAWRVIELAARLAARPDLADNPAAHDGLGALLLQARMFQHLQILQSTAAEGLS